MGLFSKIFRRSKRPGTQADTFSAQGVTILARDYVPKGETWIINEAGFHKRKLVNGLAKLDSGSTTNVTNPQYKPHHHKEG